MNEFDPHDGHDDTGGDHAAHDVGPIDHALPHHEGIPADAHPLPDAGALSDDPPQDLHFPGDLQDGVTQGADGFADDDQFDGWLAEPDDGSSAPDDPAADNALRERLAAPADADGLQSPDDLVDWALRQGR